MKVLALALVLVSAASGHKLRDPADLDVDPCADLVTAMESGCPNEIPDAFNLCMKERDELDPETEAENHGSNCDVLHPDSCACVEEVASGHQDCMEAMYAAMECSLAKHFECDAGPCRPETAATA